MKNTCIVIEMKSKSEYVGKHIEGGNLPGEPDKGLVSCKYRVSWKKVPTFENS